MTTTTKTPLAPYLIIGTLALFMAYIIQFVVRSMQTDTHLVSENYYQQEVDYQTHIDKQKQSITIQQNTRFDQKEDGLVMRLPNEINRAKGTIYLYNSIDATLDVNLPFEFSENHPLHISTTTLNKGVWKLKVDFKSHEKDYYIEKIVVLK